MTEDERAIRELIATWMRASMAGDTETVLSLMADDVVFMVAGQEPFGKQASPLPPTACAAYVSTARARFASCRCAATWRSRAPICR